jgi:hypothetical protein
MVGFDLRSEILRPRGAVPDWPGGQPGLPARLVGKSLSVFDATDVLGEFFRAH